MKTRIIFFSLLAVSAAMAASAQVVEYDDMYFTSKDRARLQASKPLTLKSISAAHEVATAINPTDSYSARNVNPEYISQNSVNPSGSVEAAPYFIPDYTPTSINQNLYNNSSSHWNNNNNFRGMGMMPGFGGMGMGMMPGFGGMGMMPGFGGPFGNFNNGMDGWGDPFGFNGFNNFNNGGWSSSIGLGFGMGGWNSWDNNSWAMGGSPFWNNNYCGFNNWNMGMGMGGFNNWNMGMGGFNNFYPRNMIIINNGDPANRNVVYGKRTSRSTDINNSVNTSDRSTSMVMTDSQGRVRGSSGRVSGGSDNTGSYYQPGWRSNPEISSSSSRSPWGSVDRSGNSSFSGNSGRSGNDNSGSFFSGNSSRSSGFNSSSNFSGGNSGGASRSSGGSSSGVKRGRD